MPVLLRLQPLDGLYDAQRRRDGKRAVVANLWSGSLTFLEIDSATLKSIATVSVGSMPRGVAFA